MSQRPPSNHEEPFWTIEQQRIHDVIAQARRRYSDADGCRDHLIDLVWSRAIDLAKDRPDIMSWRSSERLRCWFHPPARRQEELQRLLAGASQPAATEASPQAEWPAAIPALATASERQQRRVERQRLAYLLVKEILNEQAHTGP